VVEPEDSQLVDLNCYYGDPFPLLNQNGSEVVEELCEYEDDEEDLIKIVLEEHEGQMTSIPFEVSNKQMVRFLLM